MVRYRNLPRNLPGTCRSEPAPEPAPKPFRNLSFRTCPGTPPEPPGTRGPEPAPEPPRNPSFGNLEPAPEPGTRGSERNLPGTREWFGTCPETCPGTFPEPVIRNLPRNLPEPAPRKPPRNRPGAYIGKDPIAKAVREYSLCVCSVSVSVVSLMPGYILYTAPPPSFTLCLRLYHLFSHFTCQLAHATASSVEFSSVRLLKHFIEMYSRIMHYNS